MAVLVSTSVFAAEPSLNSTHGKWAVYTLSNGGNKVCYIASAPEKESGTWKKRGDRYLLITQRNAKVDEVSVSSGYPYKMNKDVIATVDGAKKYKLFVQGELAWTYDQKTDEALIKSMKRGSKVSFKGYSKVGSYSVDTYSLSGITKAYNKMKSLCK